jgi:hexosaminidase
MKEKLHTIAGIEFPVLPIPARYVIREGVLRITPSFAVSITGAPSSTVDTAVDRFGGRLSRELKVDIAIGDVDHRSPGLVIRYDRATFAMPASGDDEAYAIDVSPSRAVLTAATALGVMHGLETLFQLIQNDADGAFIRSVTMEDRPRFSWRGLMLDCSRHYMPVPLIKRNLDAMASVKLNVFHWHLSDDQGFRIECRAFPKLHELGSDGLYYTHNEVREIVRHAGDRGIRVIPEFDIPGHATAWFAAYPELASAPGEYAIEHRWGIFDPAMDPTRESTYEFLDTFLGEMASLFPDPFFHIGGDEVNGNQWASNAEIGAFQAAHGIADKHELQAYFNCRVRKLLRKYDKRMAGWDEVMASDMARDVLIQSWQGDKSLTEAVKNGFETILSHGYYLGGACAGYYSNDPEGGSASALSAVEARRILGGETCMWTERVTVNNVESRIWPFAGAVAERLWSPKDIVDPESINVRLNLLSDRLEGMGLQHRTGPRRMLAELVPLDDVPELEWFAQALTPAWPPIPPGAQFIDPVPLDRFGDAILPESDMQRDLTRYLLDPISNTRAIKRLLLTWQNAAVAVRPLFDREPRLAESRGIVDEVVDVVGTGLEAVDYLTSCGAAAECQQRISARFAPAEWGIENLAKLDRAGRPYGSAQVAIVPQVRELVKLAASSNDGGREA